MKLTKIRSKTLQFLNKITKKERSLIEFEKKMKIDKSKEYCHNTSNNQTRLCETKNIFLKF